MIRHLQKNGNKKNDPSLRAKIIAHLEKHPRYPNDLYDTCAQSNLSCSEFRQFLDEMHRDGEIHINQNGIVQLPKSFLADKEALDLDTIKFHCLVNHQRCIATTRDKAAITGFSWEHPKDVKLGMQTDFNKKGGQIGHKHIDSISIEDVDGITWDTIRTEFFDLNTEPRKKDTQIGVHKQFWASRYHGDRSKNWKPEYLILAEIIRELNNGYAVAPGFFKPPEGESNRKSKYCHHRQFILFDGDEWTPEHPAPQSLDALLAKYPDIVKDFYWIGESISSRSPLKPELRTRLLLVLPEPIHKGDAFLWEAVIDSFVDKYPFIARGPGIDKVRLSFGNARPECENRVLGGMPDSDTFSEWKQLAEHAQHEDEARDAEKAKRLKHREEQGQQRQKINQELSARGYDLPALNTSQKSPIETYCEADPAVELERHGLASHIYGDEWHWHESGQGRSFLLENGIIKPFSNSMQSASPEADGTKPVNAHRFILYNLYNLDMANDRDKPELRRKLAEAGYGQHPDAWRAERNAFRRAAVREGLASPLELRTHAPLLPVEKERPERTLRTIEENAPLITSAFKQDKRVVGLRGGTGDGKTEYAIVYVVDGGTVAISLNSTPLAEQVYQRFNDAEVSPFLWRSRWHGYQKKRQVNLIPLRTRINDFHRGELLCIKPHLCEAAHQRGVPAPVAVCSTCEVRDTCFQKGYLSQIPKAQQTQALCIAQPKLFIDPLYRGFFTELSKGAPDDRICIIDEAKAHDLFIDCELSKSVLQQWRTQWAEEALGTFAEQLLTLLEVENRHPYAVVDLINRLDENKIRLLSRQCLRYRVPYQKVDRSAIDKDTRQVYAHHSVEFNNGVHAYVAVDANAYKALQERDLPMLQPQEIQANGYLTLTPAQTFQFDIYNPDTLDGINALPRLWEQSNWTPFQQLCVFADRYQREADAPIWYHDATLHWVIPPVVHKRVKRLVCMSATLQREGFERAFDTTPHTFIETPPTKWVDGAQAFQIRTGAYPRTSLLDYDDNWKVVGLNRTGQRFLNAIENEIARDRNVKHVIITFNAIVDRHADALKEKHKNLVDVISFHKMEGLDYKQSGMVFWVLGCPDVSLLVIEARAKIIYGNDAKPLSYERDAETGEYKDRRVQLCWEAEVVSRMQQAVGRGRLNRRANTVVVFSNLLIPDFTGRACGFVIDDLEVASALSELRTIANARQRAEAETPRPLKQTRQVLAAERQAKREKREKQKHEALTLYANGMHPDKIAPQVGVDRRTVFRWIKTLNF